MEDRLQKFAKLAEVRSFTKAAQALHISQPALTTAIKKLERELRTDLIVRDSHSFALTSAGNIAYKAAKELAAHTDNLRLSLLEHINEKAPLRVGMIDSIADLLFVHGDYLQDLERETRLSLTINNSAQLLELVEQDSLDIALIAKPARMPRALISTIVGEEPLVLVAHAANTEIHNAIREKQISHFLSYNQNSRTQQLIEQHFAGHGIQLEPTFYSTSPEIMLQLVLANRGVAVLPYLLVKEHLETGKLMRITIGNDIVKRQIVSVHRAGRMLAAPSAEMLRKVQADLSTLHVEAAK